MRIYASVVTWLRWPALLAAVAGAAWIAYNTNPAQENESGLISMVPQDARSLAAQRRAAQLFELPFAADAVVVQRNPDGLSAAEQRAVYDQAAATDSAARDGTGPRMVAVPIANTLGAVPGSRESSTTALTYLGFPQDVSLVERVNEANGYADRASARPGSAVVGVTGAQPAELHEGRLVDASLDKIEIATVVLILVIVGVMFRSFIAPVAVLGVAGLAYICSLALLRWLGEREGLSQPDSLRPLMIALVLGVVTDYCIFYLSAVRTRLVAGDERLDAARRSTREITPIVLASGLILAVGLAGLRISSVGFFRDLGPGLAVTVIVAVAASLIVMPAVIAVAGRALFWPRRLDREDTPEERPGRFASFATRKPVALVIVGVCAAGLAFAAYEVRDLRLGFTPIHGLPTSAVERRAADAASKGFAPGMVAPTQILVEQPAIDGRLDQVAELEHRLLREPGVAAVFGPDGLARLSGTDPFVSKDGNAVRVLVAFDSDPHAATAIDHLNRLESAMPAMLRDTDLSGAHVSYAGDTPLAAETIDRLKGDSGRIAAVVIAANLVLLMIFLRSIVAPLLLVGASVLAVSATLGVAVWILQVQRGEDCLTYFVPFATGVLLVSLGSDYNVFVTGSVWREAERRPLPDAIALAAPRASRAIRTAGLTLAASFALIAIVPVLAFREFALIMAVGVLVETFVVRSLLVPALVALFGYTSGWPGRRIRMGSRASTEGMT
jgi:RND superfamily putative drug exporter